MNNEPRNPYAPDATPELGQGERVAEPPFPGTVITGQTDFSGRRVVCHLSGFGRLIVNIDGIEVFRRWSIGFHTRISLPQLGPAVELRYRNLWVWYVITLWHQDHCVSPNLLRAGSMYLWIITLFLLAVIYGLTWVPGWWLNGAH